MGVEILYKAFYLIRVAREMQRIAKKFALSFIVWLLPACFIAFSQEFSQPLEEKTEALIEKAEEAFYQFHEPDHLIRAEKHIDEIRSLNPKHPYGMWAKARIKFWEKERIYTWEDQEKNNHYTDQKLQLAKECHEYVDTCIKLYPDQPECHLVKGTCFVMQASTWGQGLKSLRALKPMRKSWEKVRSLPSTFRHMNGEITSQQLATFLDGVLYRVLPDSFWFWLFARVRGDKEKGYLYIKESLKAPLTQNPVMMIELASAAICHGIENQKPDKVIEGQGYIEEALKVPPRNALDRLDKKNLEYLRDHPKEACDYRREKFEAITEKSLKKGVDSEPQTKP